MADFHEVRFPTDISYGSTGGPGFSTDVVVTGAGFEQRNVNWSQARCEFNAKSGIKTQAQYDTVLAFFRARFGRGYGFRFKDWSDFKGEGQYLGAGDGETDTFQLKKYYSSGIFAHIRTINKVVAGTLKIYFDFVEQPTGWTVDNNTGLVTFTSPPAADSVITADFEFDVPVRFDVDKLPASFASFQQYEYSLPIIEIRIKA